MTVSLRYELFLYKQDTRLNSSNPISDILKERGEDIYVPIERG